MELSERIADRAWCARAAGERIEPVEIGGDVERGILALGVDEGGPRQIDLRVGLQMEGIGLPGHFITGARVDGEQVLLDPFNRGAILTAEGCSEVVARALGQPVELGAEHFAPVTNRQFLARMLNNLKVSYWRREQWDKVVPVIDRLLVLDPEAGGELRDRGFALSNQGEVARGLADWERYLTDFPNAPDHEQVKGQLRRVRHRMARLN
jgi:regulator of sirC expression with transglutaminase-like and TPR domain